MPAPAEYRRHAVAVLMQVLAVVGSELEPDHVVVLELQTDHIVDSAEMSAFISCELTAAVNGLSQLTIVLLDYLEAYAPDAKLNRAGLLRRAAAEAERRDIEPLRYDDAS
jgi:hypothetical protein